VGNGGFDLFIRDCTPGPRKDAEGWLQRTGIVLKFGRTSAEADPTKFCAHKKPSVLPAALPFWSDERATEILNV
jgi:hypothetical protein